MRSFRFRSAQIVLLIGWVVLMPGSPVRPSLLHATPCAPAAEMWQGTSLLGWLPPQTQQERRPVVEATLQSFPGAMESILSGLISWEYLEGAWAGPSLVGQPEVRSELFVIAGRGATSNLGQPQEHALNGVDYLLESLSWVSPLLLDWDDDGVPSVPGGSWQAHSGMDLSGSLAAFDIDGDRYAELTEWPSLGDRLLVAPDDPGKVHSGPDGLYWVGPISGRDLLGSTEGFKGGFEKLAVLFDANSDCAISGDELRGLYVWDDSDSDALIGTGELDSLATAGVTSLLLPLPGECVGQFVRDGEMNLLWDWWPSFARSRKVLEPGAPEPPRQLNLTPVGLPNLAHSVGPIPVDAHGWISRSDLQSAGFDFGTGRMVALSPAGTWLVLQDRTTLPSEIAAGRARRLWIFPLPMVPGADVTPTVVPLPAVHLVQFVFEEESSALVVADGGGVLFRLAFGSWNLVRLWDSPLDQPGFRAGPLASRHTDWEVWFTGCYHNADRSTRGEVLSRLVGTAFPPRIEVAADLDSIRGDVSAFGRLAEEVIVSPERMYFVVRTPGGESLLLATEGRDLIISDFRLAATGLAACGDRVLYFAETDDPGLVEARIWDSASAQPSSLGRGPFCYPYLAGDGSAAFVTSIDWQRSSLILWKWTTGDSPRFVPVFASNGIGTIRVSDDGGTLAYLGSDGCNAGTTSPAGIALASDPPRRALTLDRNPSPLPVVARVELPRAGWARVRIHDITGRLVATLMDEEACAGQITLRWDGDGTGGRRTASGIHFIRLDAPGCHQTARLLLLR